MDVKKEEYVFSDSLVQEVSPRTVILFNKLCSLSELPLQMPFTNHIFPKTNCLNDIKIFSFTPHSSTTCSSGDNLDKNVFHTN